MTPDVSSDAFAYVTNILSSILPSELTLLIVTILLLILIIGSWIIYRFNSHCSNCCIGYRSVSASSTS